MVGAGTGVEAGVEAGAGIVTRKATVSGALSEPGLVSWQGSREPCVDCHSFP